jgi:hypothetical protein
MAPSIGTFVLSHEKVRTFCDEHYKKVRERFSLGDDFLDSRGRGAGGARLRGDDRARARRFDFSQLKEGGGKGGNLMGFTQDKQYLARQRR